MDINPEIIISYYLKPNGSSNFNDGVTIINTLIEKLTVNDVKVVCNEISEISGGTISSFLENLDLGKYLIFILNEDFLQSQVCLFELYEAKIREIEYDRMFFIVLNDIQYFNRIGLIDYFYYCDNIIRVLTEKLAKISNQYFKYQTAGKLDMFKSIRVFLANISVFSTLSFIDENGTEPAIDFIIRQIFDKIRMDKDTAINSISPRYINRCPYYVLKNLVGRETYLENLQKKLDNNKIVYLYSELEGTGKTTLVRAFINNERYYKQFNHIAWVNINKNFADDFILQLSFQEDIDSDISEIDNNQKLKNKIQELCEIEGVNLLVVDCNISFDFDYLKKEFSETSWKILYIVNDFHKQQNSILLENLNIEFCKTIFYRFYKKEQNDKVLEYVIDLFYCNTLITELVAKVAASNSRLNIIKLYELLKKAKFKSSGTDKGNILFEGKEVPEKKLHLLHLVFVLLENENFSPEEEKCLLYFSVFPNVEIKEKFLLQLFQIKDYKTSDFLWHLNNLVKRGWLTINYDSYSVPSLIQPVLRRKFKPSSDNCNELISLLVEKLTGISEPRRKLADYQFFAESVLHHIHDFGLTLAKLSDLIGLYYQSIGNYSKCLKYSLKSLTIKEKNLEPSDIALAKAYNDISIIYGNLGNLNKDLEFGLKALHIRQNSLKSNDYELAESYNNVAITYRNLGDYYKSIKYHQHDIIICEEIYSGDHPNLAMSYYEIAVTFYFSKDYQKTKFYIDKAVSIWQRVFNENNPDLKNALEIQEIIHRKSGNA